MLWPCTCAYTCSSMSTSAARVAQVGVAFAPKTRSNARKFGKEADNPEADNDGVASANEGMKAVALS